MTTRLNNTVATTAQPQQSPTTISPASSEEQDLSAVEVASTPRLETTGTELHWIKSHQSQHDQTVGARRKSKQDETSLPPMGAGRPYPPDLPGQDDYIVEFDGPNDLMHPQNWSLKLRWSITAILSVTTFITTFASGIYAPAISTIAADYHIDSEVATLGVTLYVLGFAAGYGFNHPAGQLRMLWGPLSEFKGRRLPLVVAAFLTAIFHFAVAVSKDLQSILINRFFAGFFGTSHLTVGGAVFVDLFDNKTRGMAVTVFTLSVFIGPMVAPFIGGFIVTSHLGWRWTQYLSGILASAAAMLNFLFVRESYPPIILSQKAAELRRRTKNWAIHAKQEEVEVDFKELLERNFTRPLHMLAVEPIVLLISLYSSFIYGLLYLFLTAYPVIFQGVYGMKPGVSGLPELGVVIGCLCTGIVMILRLPVYRRKLERNGNIPIPEWRLPEAMFGGIIFAGGMFWLGWAGYRSQVHWIVPTIGGAVAGFGISMVFLQAFNYLIDTYLMLAASALAANTFLRSLFGGIFPLFASYMFKGMGIEWALTLLGCVASLLAVLPFLFYFKGPKIRQISRYTPKINIAVPASTPEDKV